MDQTNNLPISPVSLGTWQLGSDWGKSFSEESAFQILQEAIDQGINFLDTADVYGNGKSESFIGAFLKTVETPVMVATKFGRKGGIYPDGYSKERMRNAVLDSIERLGVNSLDLLQLHCVPTKVMKEGMIFDWLRELKKDGLIKEFGASIETVEEGLICMEHEDLYSLQVIFNIFRQKPRQKLLPLANEKDVKIIVRLPLASGLLAGKFTKDTSFPKNDHRNYNRDGQAFNVGETFAGLPFEKGIELADELKHNYLPENMNMAQMAMRWILDHEGVTCVIPGATSTNQVKQNAQVMNLPPLSEEIHKKLGKFYRENVHDSIRGPY